MTIKRYFIINGIVAIFTLISGYIVFSIADELQYIKFQYAYTILFAFISMITFFALKLQGHITDKKDKNDIKAIGISMAQSLMKLVFPLALLIPLYYAYCPVSNVYIFNFIVTYLVYMVFDTYMMISLGKKK